MLFKRARRRNTSLMRSMRTANCVGAPMLSRKSQAKRSFRVIFAHAICQAGWPKEQSHAFLIHAAAADRTFEGVDLAVLGNELQPDRLVTAEDLRRDRLTPHRPGFYGDFFLVPKGTTARLLGQPVALLIYHDFARYDAAKRRIRFNNTIVRYGAVTGPKPPPHYGAARFVRVQADEPDPEGRHAPILDATIFGKFDGDKAVWPAGDRGRASARQGHGRRARDRAGHRKRGRRCSRARAAIFLAVDRCVRDGSGQRERLVRPR